MKRTGFIGGSDCVKIMNGQWYELWEIKHTNAFTTMDKQVEYYMPQIQCYLELADMDLCIFSVIFGNSKHQATAIARDHEYIRVMRKEVLDFWNYVHLNKAPDVLWGEEQNEFKNINHKLLNAIPVDNMVKRDATLDNHFGMLSSDFTANKSSAETYENAKKGLKEIIKPNEREVYNDYITVKRNKRGAITIKRRT